MGDGDEAPEFELPSPFICSGAEPITVAARVKYCDCWCDDAFKRTLADFTFVLLFHAGMKFVCPVKRFDGLKFGRGGLGEPDRRTSVAGTGLLVDGSSEVSGARASIETGMRPACVGTRSGDGDREMRDEEEVERPEGDDGLAEGEAGAADGE